MDIEKLKYTIDTLSRIIEVSDDKKQEIIDRYSSMNDKDVIKELSQTIYCLLNTKKDLYDYALTVVRELNPEICPPVDEMKKILNKMFSNVTDGNMPIKEDHKMVEDTLVKFTKLFNKNNIDYYVVGALPCYIKINQPLFRYHDDIDILVNEKDIPLLAELIDKNGFKFVDDRFPSVERYQKMLKNKPPHTVLAKTSKNEFHIGFITFKRQSDNSITIKEYSHRLEQDKVIIDLLERQIDKVGTELRYDETPVEYKDTTFKTSSLEYVYLLKTYTNRPKDITDMKLLELYIDKNKLEEIKKHPSNDIEIKDIRNELSEFYK